MFEAVAGLFKQSPFKLGLILAIVVAISGFIMWYDHSRYQAGYDAAKVKYLEDHQEQMEALEKEYQTQVSKASDKLSRALDKKTQWKEEAIRLQGVLSNKPEEIPDVESDCTNIGTDHVRLLRDIIGEAPEVIRNGSRSR